VLSTSFWNVGLRANVMNGLVQLAAEHRIRYVSHDTSLLAK